MGKFNTKRALAMTIAVAMIICLVPTMGLAASVTINEEASNISTTGEPIVTIKGTIDNFGGDVTMMALRTNSAITDLTSMEEDNIMYIDQKPSSDTDGTFEWTFGLRETTAKGAFITVFVGGEDVDQFDFIPFEMVPEALKAPVATFSKNNYPVNEDVIIEFTDDEDWRAAISSITIDGGEDIVDDCEVAAGLIKLKLLPAGTINAVVIKATDYEDVTVSGPVSITKPSAGTASIADYREGYNCFIEDDAAFGIVLTLNDSDPTGWLSEVTIDVVDNTAASVGCSVDKSTGIITLTDSFSDTAKDYTITFTAEDYSDVAAIPFKAISKMGATELKLNKAYTVDYYGKSGSLLLDTDENYYITVPSDYTDAVTGLEVVYTVEVNGDPATIDANVCEIERPAEDSGIIKNANVYATIDGSLRYSLSGDIVIMEVGQKDVSIAEENVVLSGVDVDAFGIKDSKVVTITLDSNVINPVSQSVKVGDVVLFYAPERSVGTTEVFVGILRGTTAATVAGTVAATATIEDAASVNIYYGKISNPSYDGAIISADVARALAMLKGGASGDDYTDAQRLVADIIGGGSIQSAHVARVLASLKTSSKSGYNILP